MDRKIIIKAENLDRKIYSFLAEVSADMPIKWDINVLTLVRDAVIEAFGRMGVTLEVDEQLELSSLFFTEWNREKRWGGLAPLEKGGTG
jgi:hypothetical protein